MDTNEKRQIKKAVNEALHRLGLVYHDSMPVTDIDGILAHNGLDPLTEGIYTGYDGKHSEYVGYGLYLHFTWHRMVTGRWEIVAYVN